MANIAIPRLPEQLKRRLFEAFRLEIRYNKTTNIAHCRITIAGQTLPAAQQAIQDAETAPAADQPTHHAGSSVPICEAPRGWSPMHG